MEIRTKEQQEEVVSDRLMERPVNLCKGSGDFRDINTNAVVTLLHVWRVNFHQMQQQRCWWINWTRWDEWAKSIANQMHQLINEQLNVRWEVSMNDWPRTSMKLSWDLDHANDCTFIDWFVSSSMQASSVIHIRYKWWACREEKHTRCREDYLWPKLESTNKDWLRVSIEEQEEKERKENR